MLRCQCFPSLHHQSGLEFTKKTYSSVFLEYNLIHKGHKCLKPHTRRVYICRHIVFYEDTFSYKSSYETFNFTNLKMFDFPCLNEWFDSTNKETTLPINSQNLRSLINSKRKYLIFSFIVVTMILLQTLFQIL